VFESVTVEGVDVRRVGAGEQHLLEGTVLVPADLPAGAWAVAVSLPDGAPSLTGDARYATRFANADDAAANQRWDAATARFATGVALQVP
jgi:hypothetical protein